MDGIHTQSSEHSRPASGNYRGVLATQPRSLSPVARLVRRVLRSLGDPPLEFVLWNGERVAASGRAPVASLRIADRATLLRMCVRGQLELGDAYADGRIQVDGDLERAIEEVYLRAPPAQEGALPGGRLTRRRRNTLERSRDNVHHHYDIGNDFYALWLGETMAYTCAYYPTPAATLDEAQVAKMDHVCRKLGLAPGESVIEAGCGWGTLALHMARHYGVTVRAFNISAEQVRFARERAAALGLTRQVEFIHDDYRNITGDCDKFASVGMLEHVGTDNYAELGGVIVRCLKPNGRALIHSIGRNRPKPMHPWIERRIFPGAYPPSLAEMMQIFEPWNLSVLDVENLRLHYVRTLEHWWAAFERSRDRVAAMFDERFVRMWRLYLAGSVAAFRVGELQLFQVVCAPGRSNAIPWTRAQLYAS
jgi:cyclopropane-fatty-acyl-phospholipid synthase